MLSFVKQGGIKSPVEKLLGLDDQNFSEFFKDLGDQECQSLWYDWKFWARPNQLAPGGDWFCWLVLAGRGFGKTRMGAEWVRWHVEGTTPLSAPPGGLERIALVSQTLADGRDVMVEGESGILAISPPDFRPHYESARRRLLWPNGAQAALYSSEEPDQLRGPQHHLAWGDELAKWRHQRTCWANLLLGLRLGESPQVMATTTPKPTPLIKQLRDDPTVAITHGATFDNRAHLSSDFIYHIKRLYEGTRLGRQELYGEILEDFPGALWNRDGIDDTRVKKAPPLTRIVVAVDPPVTHGENADACGIVVAGISSEGHTYVLADLTAQGLSPHQWCKKALLAYETFEADRLVAEINQGGDLVETLIRQISPGVSYRGVRASRGKIARAEPVAALYERGLVHHVGGLNQLEDQLCSYTGEKGEKSPDRLDALVWAITDLALGNHSSPRIRSL